MYNIMSPVIAAHTCPLSASEAHRKCKNDWSFQWPRCCKKRKKKKFTRIQTESACCTWTESNNWTQPDRIPIVEPGKLDTGPPLFSRLHSDFKARVAPWIKQWGRQRHRRQKERKALYRVAFLCDLRSAGCDSAHFSLQEIKILVVVFLWISPHEGEQLLSQTFLRRQLNI